VSEHGHGDILQHPAPNSYSGQWLHTLPSESGLQPRSIDRNAGFETSLSGPIAPDRRQMREMTGQAAADFLLSQKEISPSSGR
jgi:hypothetical protein